MDWFKGYVMVETMAFTTHIWFPVNFPSTNPEKQKLRRFKH